MASTMNPMRQPAAFKKNMPTPAKTNTIPIRIEFRIELYALGV